MVLADYSSVVINYFADLCEVVNDQLLLLLSWLIAFFGRHFPAHISRIYTVFNVLLVCFDIGVIVRELAVEHGKSSFH